MINFQPIAIILGSARTYFGGDSSQYLVLVFVRNWYFGKVVQPYPYRFIS